MHDITISPIALTDEQITTIMQLTRPLQPEQRVVFFEMLAAKLRGRSDLGDGAIYRLCRDLQREVFDPPVIERTGSTSKYR
jgi:hypothetical protein